MAILPALQKKLRETIKTLHSSFPTFKDEKLIPCINRHLNNTISDIVTNIVTELFDKKIKPLLIQFREEGGCISELERNISDIATSFEPVLI